MCGICGYVGFEDENLLVRMTAQLYHRGPDEGGYFLGSGVGLGHRRLSIIDLAGGRQPLCNEDGTLWITFNGEIYNFAELRTDLETRGHQFRTGTDTEVILHAYEEYGIDCLHKFNGMWAFALWDERERTLVLARDRLGIKPVCYTTVGNALLFASEYKALLECTEVDREVDVSSVSHYLTQRYVGDSRTLFKQVHRLPPAHYLVFKEGECHMRRYWKLELDEDRSRTEEGWLEEFTDLFDDAVRMRLVSDVSVGAYLSGGLDSTSIVERLTSSVKGSVETFSVGFEGGADESDHAARTAQSLGTNHHHVFLKEGDLDLLADAIWHQEDPVGDAIVIPLYLLSRLARNRVKVVLTGEGADEFFGGYIHHTALLKGERLNRWIPGPVRAASAAIIEHLPVGLLDGLFHYPDSMGEDGRGRLAGFVRSADPLERYDLMSCLFTAGEVRALLHPDIRTAPSDGALLPVGMPLLNQIIARDAGGWLADNILFKQDRLSMAHGVEARVPFLDHRLVEFSARLPCIYKNNGRIDKAIIRRSLARRQLSQVARRRKHAFYMPLDGKFKEWFWGLVNVYLSPERIRQRGLYDERTVAAIAANAATSPLLRYKQLMSLVILEIWFEQYGEGGQKNAKRKPEMFDALPVQYPI